MPFKKGNPGCNCCCNDYCRDVLPDPTAAQFSVQPDSINSISCCTQLSGTFTLDYFATAPDTSGGSACPVWIYRYFQDLGSGYFKKWELYIYHSDSTLACVAIGSCKTAAGQTGQSWRHNPSNDKFEAISPFTCASSGDEATVLRLP